jgi:hypothetical protein
MQLGASFVRSGKHGARHERAPIVADAVPDTCVAVTWNTLGLTDAPDDCTAP